MQSLIPVISFIFLIVIIWAVIRWRQRSPSSSEIGIRKNTPTTLESLEGQKSKAPLTYIPSIEIISARVGDVEIDLRVSDGEIEQLLQEWSFVFEESRPKQLKGDEPWYKKRNQNKYRKSDPDRALDWALPFIPKSIAEDEQLRPLVEVGLDGAHSLMVQIRKLITERQAAGLLVTDFVLAEYGLRVLSAFQNSLRDPFVFRLAVGVPLDFVSLRDLLLRPVDYQQLGYEHLRFSTKVKEKQLLVDTLGEPEQHTPVAVFYADVIRQAYSRMIWQGLKSSWDLKGSEDDLKVKMKSWLSEKLRGLIISNRSQSEEDKQQQEQRRLWQAETAKRVANYPGYEPMSLYKERVVGVTRENADGTSRQSIISQLKEKEVVDLNRDPRNSQDPNAIMVCTATGKQIGFIDSNRASELAPQMDKGYKVEAWVDRVMGGDSDMSFGVLIAIQRYKVTPNLK